MKFLKIAICLMIVAEAKASVDYSNRLMLVEGYERIKKDSVYAGLVGWISPNYLSKSDSWLIEGEGRLGYTFSVKNLTTFVLYAAGGYLDDMKKSHSHERRFLRHLKEHTLEYAYGAIGLNTNHELKDVFNLGLNLKGTYGKGTIGSRFHNNKWAWGLDVGAPFTFRFGYKRHYDVVLEPFYIFLKSKHDESSYLGTRFSVAYRF